MFEDWFRPARVRENAHASSDATRTMPVSPIQTASAPEQKAISPLIALTLAGRASWGGRDYASLAREGVMQNAIAYRCVRMIAEAAASVPWLLYDGAAELEDHPLLALLAKPNANDDGRALFERWYAYLQCAGNSYLEALSAGGAVRELYVLRPDRVRAVPGPRGWPAAYTYTAGNQTTTIAPDRDTGFMPLLHATLFHPLDDTYGFSPIEAASRAIDIHNAGGRWTKRLLDKAGGPERPEAPPPPISISPTAATPPRARSRSRSAFRRCCWAFPATTRSR